MVAKTFRHSWPQQRAMKSVGQQDYEVSACADSDDNRMNPNKSRHLCSISKQGFEVRSVFRKKRSNRC